MGNGTMGVIGGTLFFILSIVLGIKGNGIESLVALVEGFVFLGFGIAMDK